MIKKISIAVLVIGLAIALYAALTSSAEAPRPELESPPPTDPFDVSIAATGIVEAASENVEIAAPVSGLVMSVPAEVGAEIEASGVLFTLDARDLEAERLSRRAALASRRAELDRLRARPRAEEVPAARAEVERLEAEAANIEDELAAVREAFEADAASQREVTRTRLNAEAARAAARRAAAELELLVAGAWEQDIRVAERAVDAARAELRATERLIERRTVRAPFAGTVLKRRIEPGESTRPEQSEPPIVLGDLSSLRVRAQVNEADLAAVSTSQAQSPARAAAAPSASSSSSSGSSRSRCRSASSPAHRPSSSTPASSISSFRPGPTTRRASIPASSSTSSSSSSRGARRDPAAAAARRRGRADHACSSTITGQSRHG